MQLIEYDLYIRKSHNDKNTKIGSSYFLKLELSESVSTVCCRNQAEQNKKKKMFASISTIKDENGGEKERERIWKQREAHSKRTKEIDDNIFRWL